MLSLLSIFFIELNFFCNLFLEILVFGTHSSSFFSPASVPSVTGFFVFFPSFLISYLHLLSVPGIQLSSKSFDNDIIEYYIGLPDLNSEPNTEVDKSETQLGICRGTEMF